MISRHLTVFLCIGKTISTKKEELIHVLDQFGIQVGLWWINNFDNMSIGFWFSKPLFSLKVDNPVSVLNQDTSRNFLNTSDPKDKYKVTNIIIIWACSKSSDSLLKSNPKLRKYCS